MAREIRAPEQVNGFRDRRRSCGDCDNLRMYEGVPACIYTERDELLPRRHGLRRI